MFFSSIVITFMIICISGVWIAEGPAADMIKIFFAYLIAMAVLWLFWVAFSVWFFTAPFASLFEWMSV
jgi:hypothetical protein